MSVQYCPIWAHPQPLIKPHRIVFPGQAFPQAVASLFHQSPCHQSNPAQWKFQAHVSPQGHSALFLLQSQSQGQFRPPEVLIRFYSHQIPVVKKCPFHTLVRVHREGRQRIHQVERFFIKSLVVSHAANIISRPPINSLAVSTSSVNKAAETAPTNTSNNIIDAER